MHRTIFMEKYPVFSREIQKSDTQFKSVDSIIEHLMGKISNHPVATFITIFDHYTHTQSMEDGVINPSIKDAKNLIFCFGKQLPTSTILAVRPRSIGVCELENSFMIEFLEVPNEQLQKVVQEWIVAL